MINLFSGCLQILVAEVVLPIAPDRVAEFAELLEILRVAPDIACQLGLPIRPVGVRDATVIGTLVEEAAVCEDREREGGNNDVWLPRQVAGVLPDSPTVPQTQPYDLLKQRLRSRSLNALQMPSI